MKNKISNQELSEIARQKLDSNAELWKAESEYVKLENKETRVLQFNPEKMEPVKGQYAIRISYTVLTPITQTKGKRSLKRETDPAPMPSSLPYLSFMS